MHPVRAHRYPLTHSSLSQLAHSLPLALALLCFPRRHHHFAPRRCRSSQPLRRRSSSSAHRFRHGRPRVRVSGLLLAVLFSGGSEWLRSVVPPVAGDFGVFSQAPSYGVGSSTRRSMEGLDLNIDAVGFPYMGSYQGLLQGDFAPGGRGLLPLRIGARSRAGGFVPPRPTAGATRSGKRPATCAVVRRSRVGTSSSRARAPAARLHGSVASGS